MYRIVTIADALTRSCATLDAIGERMGKVLRGASFVILSSSTFRMGEETVLSRYHEVKGTIFSQAAPTPRRASLSTFLDGPDDVRPRVPSARKNRIRSYQLKSWLAATIRGSYAPINYVTPPTLVPLMLARLLSLLLLTCSHSNETVSL